MPADDQNVDIKVDGDGDVDGDIDACLVEELCEEQGQLGTLGLDTCTASSYPTALEAPTSCRP